MERMTKDLLLKLMDEAKRRMSSCPEDLSSVGLQWYIELYI